MEAAEGRQQIAKPRINVWTLEVQLSHLNRDVYSYTSSYHPTRAGKGVAACKRLVELNHFSRMKAVSRLRHQSLVVLWSI